MGTYTVDCSGIGTVTRVLTVDNSRTATSTDDILITEAVERGGRLIATKIQDAQRDPSVVIPGGVFVIRTHTLRPSTGTPDTNPTPPTTPTAAIAGPKNAIVFSRTAQLDGSRSTSADGKPLTYLWTIPPGSPSAVILGAATANPTVQFGQGRGGYTFQLTVTDSAGKSSSDLVTLDYQGS